MIITAPSVSPPQSALRISSKDLAQEGIRTATLKRPRVVLCRAEIDVLEAINAFVAKERVFQIAFVVVAKEDTEGVLRIVATPAKSTANAQPRVDLETIPAVLF